MDGLNRADDLIVELRGVGKAKRSGRTIRGWALQTRLEVSEEPGAMPRGQVRSQVNHAGPFHRYVRVDGRPLDRLGRNEAKATPGKATVVDIQRGAHKILDGRLESF